MDIFGEFISPLLIIIVAAVITAVGYAIWHAGQRAGYDQGFTNGHDAARGVTMHGSNKIIQYDEEGYITQVSYGEQNED